MENPIQRTASFLSGITAYCLIEEIFPIVDTPGLEILIVEPFDHVTTR